MRLAGGDMRVNDIGFTGREKPSPLARIAQPVAARD